MRAVLVRFNVSTTASDEYVFRAAPLRNVALRAPPTSIPARCGKQAVGVMGSSQLGARLTDTEENDIVAFLQTLTGQLPNVQYPVLPTGTNSTPEPLLVK